MNQHPSQTCLVAVARGIDIDVHRAEQVSINAPRWRKVNTISQSEEGSHCLVPKIAATGHDVPSELLAGSRILRRLAHGESWEENGDAYQSKDVEVSVLCDGQPFPPLPPFPRLHPKDDGNCNPRHENGGKVGKVALTVTAAAPKGASPAGPEAPSRVIPNRESSPLRFRIVAGIPWSPHEFLDNVAIAEEIARGFNLGGPIPSCPEFKVKRTSATLIMDDLHTNAAQARRAIINATKSSGDANFPEGCGPHEAAAGVFAGHQLAVLYTKPHQSPSQLVQVVGTADSFGQNRTKAGGEAVWKII